MAEVTFSVYGVPVESSCFVIALARDDHGGQRAAEQVVGVLRAYSARLPHTALQELLFYDGDQRGGCPNRWCMMFSICPLLRQLRTLCTLPMHQSCAPGTRFPGSFLPQSALADRARGLGPVFLVGCVRGPTHRRHV